MPPMVVGACRLLVTVGRPVVFFRTYGYPDLPETQFPHRTCDKRGSLMDLDSRKSIPRSTRTSECKGPAGPPRWLPFPQRRCHAICEELPTLSQQLILLRI